MPVYILHGFRWPRGGFTGIRVHIIVNNLEDAAAEYIQTPESQKLLLDSFHKAHPEIMKNLPNGLTFIEQYNPDDEFSENAVSQPYAYVADKVITMAMPGDPQVTGPTSPASAKRTSKSSGTSSSDLKAQSLGVNIEDVIAEGPGLSAKGWDAFADLRDAIAPGEKIGWWIVYNGDPERAFDDFEDEEEEYEEDEEEEEEEQHEENTVPQASGSIEDDQRTVTLENIRKKPVPIPLRTKPKPPKTTPLEEQKSPLREAPKETFPSSQPQAASNKKLPPVSPSAFPLIHLSPLDRTDLPCSQIPPPKPGKTPQRPTTPAKPDSLKKKLFGKKP